jgi:DNA modification methylase
MEVNKIYTGNCLDVLKTLPDNSINCCVTSPPYWGLRDYGHDEQIGMEETPDKFVENMITVFSEVKRVLKNDGTLWLNLGDTYSAHKDCKSVSDSLKVGGKSEAANVIEKGKSNSRNSKLLKSVGLKNKDLIGVPWMVAFALRSNGWYLRQDIIWSKKNCMPESVKDRCTKAHEYIFLLSKSSKYYFDNEAIKTKMDCSEHDKLVRASRKRAPTKIINGIRSGNDTIYEFANKRSVWETTLTPFKEAHFATFPEDLIVDCIKAGCPEEVCNKCGKARERVTEKQYINHENWFGDKQDVRHSRCKAGTSYNELVGTETTGFTDCGCNAGFSRGIVLDPFMGAGTTALVASKLNRNFIGIELNPEYVKITEKRLQKELGMFNQLTP